MLLKKQSSLIKIIILTVFSVAMGFMESAVVVYLREIYYPGGFKFPLKAIDDSILLVEFLREAATLIMLVSVGIIAGRTKTEKFGFFIFCFAIWDISYYVFLYLLLGWPASLLTWDILFLIPVTWVGPVVGPVINSISMIMLAFIISYFTSINIKTRINLREWVLLILGSLVIILSYVEDYVSFMMEKFSVIEIFSISKNTQLMEHAGQYIPESFLWWIFIVGEIVVLLAIILIYMRNALRKIHG